MNDVRLAAVATLQAHKIHKLQTQLAVVRRRNADLRSRVTKLEHARDRWKARASRNRATIMVLRSAVYQTRRSRDLWKHRTMTKGDAII